MLMQTQTTGKLKGQEEETQSWKDSSSQKSEDGSVLSSVKQGVSQGMHKAQELGSDLKDKAQEYGEMAVEETNSFIRRYPTQVLIAGLGAGLLIGYFLPRKSA